MKIQPKRPQEMRDRMGRVEDEDPYIFGLPNPGNVRKNNELREDSAELAKRG
jgi:hypothetical protein